jgi:hypothetical protein
MYKTFSMELGGRTLSVDIGRVAASIYALWRYRCFINGDSIGETKRGN